MHLSRLCPSPAALLCVLLLLSLNYQNSHAEETGTIMPVKDNVYRFTYGHYHTVFMVSDAGIFVADPVNPPAARQLQALLAERYEQPIRYMAYSHSHVDHILGGDILDNDTVTVIAHQQAAADIRMTRLPTALPEVTFTDELAISLGNSQVTMRYHGPNNGRGSISMHFMPANVLFVVDWIVVGRMPYRELPGYDIHGMIQSTQEILSGPDFEIFVGGHAEMGSREDVEHYQGYLQALYAAVRDGMLAGKSLAELQQTIRLPGYADLLMYEEWLPLNIAGVYRTLNDMSYFDRRPDIPSAQTSD